MRSGSVQHTHSQALGTAAWYQRLRHHCAAHYPQLLLLLTLLLWNLWLHTWKSSGYCQNIPVLAHICLICYLDYYQRMAEIGKDPWRWSGPAPCSSKTTRCWLPRLPTQLLKCLQGWELHSPTGHLLQCSATGQRSVSQHPFVPGVVPPQLQDLALHEVSLSPFPPTAILYCYIWSKLLQNHLFALDSAD